MVFLCHYTEINIFKFKKNTKDHIINQDKLPGIATWEIINI